MGRFSVHLFLMLVFSAGNLRAHEITAISVVADLKGWGEYSLSVGADVKLVRDPFGENESEPAGKPPADPNAPLTEEEIAEVERQVEEYIAVSLRFYFDRTPFVPDFRIEEEKSAGEPEEAAPVAGEGQAPQRRYNARAEGRIFEGAKEFLLEATPEAKAPVVLIIFKNGKPTRRSQVLYSGEFSRPVELAALEEMPGAVDGSVGESTEAVTAWQAIQRYGALGFEQFFPKGLDHILFVLGLFLLCTGTKPLFQQVAAFTLAHSLALSFAVLGGVELPPGVVETVIALSVAYVGIENLWMKRVTRWRLVAVFAFGLFHGLAFAGAFMEAGPPKNRLMAALVSFNAGLEIGQLSVILIACAAVFWMWGRPIYRKAAVIPCSILIAMAGLYWAFERIFF